MTTLRSLITTPFTAADTTDDVLRGVDLRGVRVVVTGASSGLGKETARALALSGAEVTMAVRNESAGLAAVDELTRAGAQAPPRVALLDLADRSSVARFVDEWEGTLHLLVNNAGVITRGLERNRDGLELQFATNHLGHFALATGLRRALAAGASERGGARIVSLSSTAHMRAGIDFEDLQFERRRYDPQIAYAQAKTANSLLSVEATRRWASDGIVANTVNPGGVATGLQRNFSPRQKASLDAAEAAGVFAYKTVEQGAATTIVAAVRPEFAHTGGHYLDDAQEAYMVPDDATLADHPHGVKEWALDPEAAERLWKVSRRLVFD
ncbi:SDR family NAD(P)-dependent oxidoreductase [Humibacter albus]|uniref:SDR family NAD(P)-dependent oxidoreductase n=1 Tax=Humibacter albus TaxID=427754 RepID=UPI0003B62741|nr:SDR family NAD(P)-dependent oxidoreductase [Humibacter albus]